MKRKTVAGILALCMAASLLPGCGKKDGSSDVKTSYTEYPSYQAGDYVTPGTYEEMVLYRDMGSIEVSEEEVLDYMASMLSPVEVEDKLVDGDTAVIDFTGTVDGKEFVGGSGSDYELVLGSGSFIDGFEDQLAGLLAGETKTVKVTFPEGYPAAGDMELAGKDADFAVTVKAVKRLPELTDEAVAGITGGAYTTIQDYQVVLKDQMEASNQSSYDSQMDSMVLSELLDTSEFKKDAPKELVDWYVEMNVTAYAKQAEANEMELDEFIHTYSNGSMADEAALRDELSGAAPEELKAELLIHAIAELEGFEVDEDYYKENLEIVANSVGFNSGEEFEAEYPKSVIRNTMLTDIVLDFIESSVVIKPTSEQPGTEMK